MLLSKDIGGEQEREEEKNRFVYIRGREDGCEKKKKTISESRRQRNVIILMTELSLFDTIYFCSRLVPSPQCSH